MPTILLAPAKINLFLDILRRREDGYHDLHTAFLAVDLCDRLEIESRPGAGGVTIDDLHVSGPFARGVPSGENNIMHAAAHAFGDFLRQSGRGDASLSLSINLEKNIPHGAGLGGGSSDAAAVLYYLAESFGFDPAGADLMRIAASVGSDCAFFLGAPAAEGTGRGEILTSLPARDFPILLAVPGFAIGTADAYGALRPDMLGPRSDAEGLRQWLARETEELPRLDNTFELAMDRPHPELRQIRDAMIKSGALLARLSGSGSASFGIFPDEASRMHARAALEGEAKCFDCRPRRG